MLDFVYNWFAGWKAIDNIRFERENNNDWNVSHDFHPILNAVSDRRTNGYREMGQLRYFRSITYIAEQSDAWINKFFEKIWCLARKPADCTN